MRKLFTDLIKAEKEGEERGKGFRFSEAAKEDIIVLRKKINEEADRRILSFGWEDYGVAVSWLFVAYPPTEKDYVIMQGKKCIESKIHKKIFKEIVMNDLIFDKMGAYEYKEKIQKIFDDAWKKRFDSIRKELSVEERLIEVLSKGIIEVDINELAKLRDEELMIPEVYEFAVSKGLRTDRSYIRHLYSQFMMVQTGMLELIISKFK
ncbi:MAG: hypothetical protein QXI58_03265 [Candidatus Micrarchaeia archaeon]